MNKTADTIEETQNSIEIASFDVMNQHDKTSGLLFQLITELEDMMSREEAIGYHLEMYVQEMELVTMVKEQGEKYVQVCQLIQNLLDESTKENDLIHALDIAIARQREHINALKK